MRLSDKYYDLVLERDQLLEELEDIEKELEEMEEQKPRFMLVKEIVDIEHDECIFYTHEEFNSYVDVKVVFDIHVSEAKDLMDNVKDIVEHDDIFHIENDETSINLIIYDMEVE